MKAIKFSKQKFFDAIMSQDFKNIIRNRYNSMKQRCYNQNNKDYLEYGGRGIKVCDEWLDFEEFFKWYQIQMSKFADLYENIDEALANLQLDRKDGNGGYSPKNCRLLEKEINQYASSVPSRCIMYNGSWAFCWQIDKIMNVKGDKKLSDRIRLFINGAKNDKWKGSNKHKTAFSLLTNGVTRFVKKCDINEIMKICCGFVWYDFHKDPLIFENALDNDYKDLRAECPKCKNASVELKCDMKELRAVCDCGFNELLVTSDMKADLLDYKNLEKLPLLIKQNNGRRSLNVKKKADIN